MATSRSGEEGGFSRQRLRRSFSVNDAVPLKTRMYSAWYRFRYGEVQSRGTCIALCTYESIHTPLLSFQTRCRRVPLVGWQFQSSVHLDSSPVWLLGRCYHSVDPDGELQLK